MINAVAEAKALAKKEAEKTTVFVPLSILQALLDEIDRLQPRTIGDVVTNMKKDTA
jgi:hypothetical protein